MRLLHSINREEINFKFSDRSYQVKLKALDDRTPKHFKDESLEVRIKDEEGYLKTIQCQAEDGLAVFRSELIADLPIGNYEIELCVNKDAIYPEIGFLPLHINQNATQFTGDKIATIAVNDFEKRFRDLEEDIKRFCSDGTYSLEAGKVTTVEDEKDASVDIQRDGDHFVLNIAVPRGHKGEKGDRGEQGLRGDQGIQGVQGPEGKQGLQGTQGVQGIKGEQGERGETGPRGEKGDPGKPFVIDKIYPSVAEMRNDKTVKDGAFVMINSSVNDEENARLYLYQDQTFNYITDLSGAQGIQGPKGDKGDKGDKGEQGTQGVQGIQGIQGEQGVAGKDGYSPKFYKTEVIQNPYAVNNHGLTDFQDWEHQGIPTSKDLVINGEGELFRIIVDGSKEANNYVWHFGSSLGKTRGRDGITPHIDEKTKHWFIGEKDTGVNARVESSTRRPPTSYYFDWTHKAFPNLKDYNVFAFDNGCGFYSKWYNNSWDNLKGFIDTFMNVSQHKMTINDIENTSLCIYYFSGFIENPVNDISKWDMTNVYFTPESKSKDYSSRQKEWFITMYELGIIDDDILKQYGAKEKAS